jgi:hypothetical protein
MEDGWKDVQEASAAVSIHNNYLTDKRLSLILAGGGSRQEGTCPRAQSWRPYHIRAQRSWGPGGGGRAQGLSVVIQFAA